MHGAGVLQPGGDPRAVRHQRAARLGARGAARQQVQLQTARARRPRAAAAPQRRHGRGGRLQPAHGHALRALHDLLATTDGELTSHFRRLVDSRHARHDYIVQTTQCQSQLTFESTSCSALAEPFGTTTTFHLMGLHFIWFT